MTDSQPGDITILHSVNRLLATKRIRRDHNTGKLVKSPYGNEKHFRIFTVNLTSFSDLAECLCGLTQQHCAFVVRGEPLPETNRERARRLLHDDPETGDNATFAQAPRHWFAVDLDKVPCPASVDVVDNPDGAIEFLVELLPPELHEAACWWQFTSSQGLPGAEGTLSARLWFWNLLPLDDASLTRWALATNKSDGKIIDASLYRAVQVHYVANPIFQDGAVDPLPWRCGTRAGLDEAVSLVIPEPDPVHPYAYSGCCFVGIGVDAFLAQIGGERGFRSPMVAAIASYFASNGADANPEPIKARLRQAIINAPRGGRGNSEIARYISDRHLNDVIGWVRVREKANPRPPASSKAMADRLEYLASAVPVGGERDAAVRTIAAELIRVRRLHPLLVLDLVGCWNDRHCSPPLSRDQVITIVDTLAARQLAYERDVANARR